MAASEPAELKKERKARRKARVKAALKAAGDLSSGSSSDGEVAAATVKKRPGRGKTLDRIKIPVAFPTHVNLQEWDAQIMNACFQGGGHTDRKEFEWLQNVLDVKEQNMMTLVNVPTEMAEVDKLLVAALRKENWLPPELARAVLKVEANCSKPGQSRVQLPAKWYGG